jgi:ethanolamine-phosphate cytidylyltransferase
MDTTLPETNVDLLNFVIKIFPHLQQENFLRKVTATQNHFFDSEKEQKYNQDFLNFLDFLEKNSPPEAQAIPTPSLKVKRLYVDGCFDLVHSGHFNALRQAKALCETLVVGVISDEAIFQNKG